VHSSPAACHALLQWGSVGSPLWPLFSLPAGLGSLAATASDFTAPFYQASGEKDQPDRAAAEAVARGPTVPVSLPCAVSGRGRSLRCGERLELCDLCPFACKNQISLV
jgi:hypothetical protein